MLNNQLENLDNTLGFKPIAVKYIDRVNDYIFIALDNGQKILTNGIDLYDVSDYIRLKNVFTMNDKICAVLTKSLSICVISLKTMEVLYEDKNADYINKQDERTIFVLMKTGDVSTSIYDIETQKYLPAPPGYEFEHSLGNNLYVFKEKFKPNTKYYNDQRCVVNTNGKIILKDIKGWIDLSDDHLFIINEDEISIIKINSETTLEMNTIKQTEKNIVKPIYYNGNLIIIEKGIIKIYNPQLEIINEYLIDELDEIINYQIILDTLKIVIPFTVDNKQVNKYLYVNLKTGKIISHVRIESYPYWAPTTYIGYDNIDEEIKNYHFYNASFTPIVNVLANSYECLNSNKESIFFLKTKKDKYEKKQILNTENGCIKEINYDYARFHNSLPYGYGVNFANETMDFFDENLNIIIPNFKYTEFNLSFQYTEFNYFIINDYICIKKHLINDFGQSKFRNIIYKTTGEVVLDSINHKCYALGNFIQIISDDSTLFLNTNTGEIGSLVLNAPNNKKGKIDFKNLNNITSILAIDNNIQLVSSSKNDTLPLKRKKPYLSTIY